MSSAPDGRRWKMLSVFARFRRRVYASLNGTKGNLVKLSKSRLLTKDEKIKLNEVIEKMTELTDLYKSSWKNEQN